MKVRLQHGGIGEPAEARGTCQSSEVRLNFSQPSRAHHDDVKYDQFADAVRSGPACRQPARIYTFPVDRRQDRNYERATSMWRGRPPFVVYQGKGRMPSGPMRKEYDARAGGQSSWKPRWPCKPNHWSSKSGSGSQHYYQTQQKEYFSRHGPPNWNWKPMPLSRGYRPQRPKFWAPWRKTSSGQRPRKYTANAPSEERSCKFTINSPQARGTVQDVGKRGTPGRALKSHTATGDRSVGSHQSLQPRIIGHRCQKGEEEAPEHKQAIIGDPMGSRPGPNFILVP